MESFTPVSALIGGAMIGAAAALLLILTGRVAGVSGVLGGVLSPRRTEVGWRVAFLTGLLVAPLFYGLVAGGLPRININASTGMLAVAGVLVGLGSRLGAGCTSGHGVCGVGRGSLRSLVATAVFMATAIATLFVVRHLWGA